MQVPSPKTFTHMRPTSTISAGGRTIPATPTTIETGVPGLFSPSGTRAIPSEFGVFEQMEDTLYLEPVDDDGDDRVVQAGDLLEDEDNGNVWKAIKPGNTFENPALYNVGRKVKHHIEIAVERVNPDTQKLA
jgi:hypothetical protein